MGCYHFPIGKVSQRVEVQNEGMFPGAQPWWLLLCSTAATSVHPPALLVPWAFCSPNAIMGPMALLPKHFVIFCALP